MAPPATGRRGYSQHMDKENLTNTSKFRPFQGKQTSQAHSGRLPPQSAGFGHHGNKPPPTAFGSRVNAPTAHLDQPPTHTMAATAPGRAVEPSTHHVGLEYFCCLSVSISLSLSLSLSLREPSWIHLHLALSLRCGATALES